MKVGEDVLLAHSERREATPQPVDVRLRLGSRPGVEPHAHRVWTPHRPFKPVHSFFCESRRQSVSLRLWCLPCRVSEFHLADWLTGKSDALGPSSTRRGHRCIRKPRSKWRRLPSESEDTLPQASSHLQNLFRSRWHRLRQSAFHLGFGTCMMHSPQHRLHANLEVLTAHFG